MKYWLGVVSKEHVQRGVRGGFAQICHGKRAPLTRLKAGDGFVYYSPKMAMDGTEPCKCFTAIGRVKEGKVYQVELALDFHPFRIDIEYFPSIETSIADIELELTQSPSWGMKLRRGLIEISRRDFDAVAMAMRSR
jgi:hypothetical protein